MSFSRNLLQLYFDWVYNVVYDCTIAQTAPYHRLQRACLDKLEFEDSHRVLCVGVGTGNEILRLLEKKGNINLVGVDTSRRALARAYKKTLKGGKAIKLLKMDAHRLHFAAESFDKVLCLHLMGFLDDDRRATAELVRTLKSGGQFVITYPSGDVGTKLVAEIKGSVIHSFISGRYGKVVKESLAAAGAIIINVPVVLFWEGGRPRQGYYSRQSLDSMFTGLKLKEYYIEEYSAYQDLIVYGTK